MTDLYEGTKYGAPNWPKAEPGTEAFEAEQIIQEHIDQCITTTGKIEGCMLTVHVVFMNPRSKYEWTAHYAERPDAFSEGSTPYMAIRSLIDNINPTEWINNRKGG